MSDQLLNVISSLVEHNPERLSELGAGILAASYFEISSDSRSFAREFGIAHALVLRECVALAEEQKLIELDNRNDRSQRLFYSLSFKGQRMISEAA